MTNATHNLDEQEISRFEALAARWWDPEGEFKPLHDINPLRLDYIDRAADINGKRVLDVGCGGGLLCEAMAGRGAVVTGIDMGEASLAVARLHLLESGRQVDYRHCTAEELADSEEPPFDVVTCLEMLEHVPEPASIVSACARMVKPGGDVFFSTINRNPKSYLFAVLGAEYILRLLPRGTHDYSRFIRPSELSAWARNAGLETVDLTGMSYNPLAASYSLGTDIDVNYLVHCHR